MSETPGRQGPAPREPYDEASGLSNAQRETLKSALEHNRRQLLAQLDETGARAADSPFPSERDRDDEMHALEAAEINVELHEHAQQELAQIDAALKRLELGNYGVCCDCANAIGFARLEAYPTARRCIACKRVHEQRS